MSKSKKHDESQIETDLTRALTRDGWDRGDDMQPKNELNGWPYFSKGPWRVLIGTLGWTTVYRLDKQNYIQDQESVRTERLDDVVQLTRRVKA